MKSTIRALGLSALLVPSLTFASGIVQVDTKIENVNGGTLTANGIPMTRLVTPTGAYSKFGTPQFFIPEGFYEVRFTAPEGYTEVHSSNCTGHVIDGQTVHCHVIYSDGTPPQEDAFFGAVDSSITFPAPQVTLDMPQQVAQPAPQLPVMRKSGLTDSQVAAIINILKAFGVDSATIAQVQSFL